MTKLILSAATGFLLAAAMLWFLWTQAPYPLIDGEEYESLLQEVVSTELEQSSSQQSVIYIKPDLKPVITRLQKRFPKWQLRPSSQRPEHDCESTAPCIRDDYLSVDCATFPLWRTALVTVSAANSGAELLLIEIGSRWTIVSRKGFVI